MSIWKRLAIMLVSLGVFGTVGVVAALPAHAATPVNTPAVVLEVGQPEGTTVVHGAIAAQAVLDFGICAVSGYLCIWTGFNGSGNLYTFNGTWALRDAPIGGAWGNNTRSFKSTYHCGPGCAVRLQLFDHYGCGIPYCGGHPGDYYCFGVLGSATYGSWVGYNVPSNFQYVVGCIRSYPVYI